MYTMALISLVLKPIRLHVQTCFYHSLPDLLTTRMKLHLRATTCNLSGHDCIVVSFASTYAISECLSPCNQWMPITTTDKYCKSAHQYCFCFRFYCKHCLLQQAPTYQKLYPSLTFLHNFCIPSPPYLAQEVAPRLIKHVNINIKRRVCTFYQFIGNCYIQKHFFHNVVALGIVRCTDL